jgi:hypothetical protein
MSTKDEAEPAPPLPREDLIALVTRAHLGSKTADSHAAGSALAAQSRLPKRVAENLGAGFGQWDYFPEIADIVDFALTYVPPETETDLMALARAWASDEAASRRTLLTLVGRDILSHELRRIDVPALREVIDEHRPTRARELRLALGLDVRPVGPPTVGARNKRAADAPAEPAKSAPEVRAPAHARASAPGTPESSPPMRRMPKPERKPPAAPKPPEDIKRFQHPKFGDGVLQAQEGTGPDAKLTIAFESGPKTVLARFVTELPVKP